MKRGQPIARTIATIVGIAIIGQIILRLVRKLWHVPAPAFIGRFLDSDFRRWLQPPEQIIARSGIAEGMQVLEVGCGSGAYTTFVARAVGESGEVHALDIQPAMLAQLARKLQRPENRELTNVRLHQASAYALPFEDGELDLVYMVTVLQEIPDRARTLAEIRRVLRPGGILAVTEWITDPDYVLSSTTVRGGINAGFQVAALLGNLWAYTVRFTRPAEQPAR